MTSTRDDHSLSRLELVVLARLSQSKPPKEDELVSDVSGLALQTESPGDAGKIIDEVFTSLRARGLASDRMTTRRPKRRLLLLTDDGRRALRAGLGLARTPTWSRIRDAHLPALALGLRPGSEQAKKSVSGTDAMTAAVLREQFGLREAFTVSTVCDTLLAEALGLPPGPVTLKILRAHVLARRAGVEGNGAPEEIAAQVAAKAVHAQGADTKRLARDLGRRWVREAEQPTRPVQQPPPEQPSPPAQPAAAEALLAVVREALPQVGAEGRFGAEKVFVSAIWHRIERDRRLVDLSLDRFKRWLVTANRDGWLVLARADLVGAMDARLVSESEIEDRGDTFHFVLDQRNGALQSERGFHVR